MRLKKVTSMEGLQWWVCNAHEKKEMAILEKWERRRRVWWRRWEERESPWSWREDSIAWKGLWCWIRMLEINSAS